MANIGRDANTSPDSAIQSHVPAPARPMEPFHADPGQVIETLDLAAALGERLALGPVPTFPDSRGSLNDKTYKQSQFLQRSALAAPSTGRVAAEAPSAPGARRGRHASTAAGLKPGWRTEVHTDFSR